MLGGAQAAPVDRRYLERGRFSSEPSGALPGVMSFLEQIYGSVAENLPDVRDGTYDDVLDPYAEAAETSGLRPDESAKGNPSRTKTKQHRRQVPICPMRTVQAGCETRWLPPGTIKDYWIQYKQQVQGPVASFPSFWRALPVEIQHIFSDLL